MMIALLDDVVLRNCSGIRVLFSVFCFEIAVWVRFFKAQDYAFIPYWRRFQTCIPLSWYTVIWLVAFLQDNSDRPVKIGLPYACDNAFWEMFWYLSYWLGCGWGKALAKFEVFLGVRKLATLLTLGFAICILKDPSRIPQCSHPWIWNVHWFASHLLKPIGQRKSTRPTGNYYISNSENHF